MPYLVRGSSLPPSFYVGIYAEGRGRVGIGREQTRLQTLEKGPPATTYSTAATTPPPAEPTTNRLSEQVSTSFRCLWSMNKTARGERGGKGGGKRARGRRMLFAGEKNIHKISRRSVGHNGHLLFIYGRSPSL